MKLNPTQDPEVFRVTYKGKSKLFEWPELMWWLEDVDQAEHCEGEIPEFEVWE
jgi:hypothetical protein